MRALRLPRYLHPPGALRARGGRACLGRCVGCFCFCQGPKLSGPDASRFSVRTELSGVGKENVGSLP
jgi:hypothetical protein